MNALSVAGPDLTTYDTIIVALSGGKDSVACLCLLLEAGVDTSRIELWHHDVDGQGRGFMDWPSTLPYVQALADAYGIPLYRSWRNGGFEAEMLRHDCPTGAVWFDTPFGMMSSGGNGPAGTRERFPQVSADLSVRWCSSVLKIGVMDAAIRGQERFLGRRTLVLTGERAEESPSRARYAVFEPHRSDTRAGTRRRRHVDHWRPVHNLATHAVWDILRRHRIVPALPYQIGFGRLSCMNCIFGSAAHFATIRFIAPDWFERLVAYERKFQCTIKRLMPLDVLADRGEVFEIVRQRPDLVAAALAD
ncbi:MAG: phosphoadenosine phosphosulfate reductase family protein [Janthinobacterium lividum]